MKRDPLEKAKKILRKIKKIAGRVNGDFLLNLIEVIFFLKVRVIGTKNIKRGGYVYAIHPHSDVMETMLVFNILRRGLGTRGFYFLIIYWLPTVVDFLCGNQFIKKFNFLIREKNEKWRWYKEAVKYLDEGYPVVLYMTSFLKNFKSGSLGTGAARLALETQKPIIPVLVKSSVQNGMVNFLKYLFNPFKKIDIIIGKPFIVSIPDKREAAEYIVARILRLKELKNSSG